MKETLEIYFDFSSPYSYLCWKTLEKENFLETYNVDLTARPVVLGKVVLATQLQGPAEIKSKRNYLFKDCMRKARELNVNFQIPYQIPFNSSYLLRASCFSESKDLQFKIISLLFDLCWSKEVDVENFDILKEKLDAISGLSFEKIDQFASSEEARTLVRSYTKQATEKEIFGLPTFFIKSEIFWGQDSIVWLKKFLENKDVLDDKIVQRFEQDFPIRR